MVLGRLFHWGFDAMAISALLAGVKKTTGFSPATEMIPDSSVRSIANGYLGAGETIFNLVSGQAVTSQYFKRNL
ncbi:uncharacterized protein MKK02DRAFT_43290 [Dioszegia hungarica]|uniref:DUF1748-domain-containing protein n=1 Tax=Dioszegia hungarica TaxID=4972 RepID=A0AA38LX17_9TREE|nr:uncharacterized protein MKK02DRAFT_43290 [Dioszegia hungarica]KAI9637364.1 hypothetical protein MKK02DRAFT_43290 [Dioszegia hungarica]